MSEAYSRLLDLLADRDRPHQTLTLQLCFILYLVAGQFAALLLWRLIAPRAASTWRLNVAFGLYLLAAQAVLFLAWPPLVGGWQSADNVLLADAVVAVHLALVLGVLLLLLLVPVGGLLGWGWTRNFWLRLTHLLVIEIVAGQALVGIECPLKTLERQLRGGLGHLHPEAGEASPLGVWCNRMLYYPGEPWLFTTIYAAVGLLVLLGWVAFPPRLPWRDRPKDEPASNGTSHAKA